MDHPGLTELLALQSGVVSRAQVLGLGLASHDVRRRVRRREWAQVHPGVYVDHTGPLVWEQRAWAAVLALAPAALSHVSALGPHPGPIRVAVDRSRTVVAPAGVERHYLVDLDGRTRWSASPPRLRIEHAVLGLASSARNELDAVAHLADVVGARRTTAGRVVEALAGYERLPRRSFIASVLADVDAGTCSVLEHGYLARVERPHGLPRAGRQVVASSRGTVYRDVEYAARSRAGRRARRTSPRPVGRGSRPRPRPRSRRRGARAPDSADRLGAGVRPPVLDGVPDRRPPAARWVGGRGQEMPRLRCAPVRSHWLTPNWGTSD